MSAEVIKMASTDGAGEAIEAAPAKLEWEGREVEPRHLPMAVYEEITEKEMTGREGLYHILLHSLHYKDDGTRVFKTRADISKVPQIRVYLVLKLAIACGNFNKPPESENPLPNV